MQRGVLRFAALRKSSEVSAVIQLYLQRALDAPRLHLMCAVLQLLLLLLFRFDVVDICPYVLCVPMYAAINLIYLFTPAALSSNDGFRFLFPLQVQHVR